MKKIISTVAALGLVAGMAGTASALDFTLSGQYVLEGYMMSGADGDGVCADEDAGTDSAWVHTFQLKPTMNVNDKIKMVADIRMMKDTDWGSQDDVNRTKAVDSGYSDFDRTVDVHKLYMEYLSPVGKIRAGRTPAGAWAGDFLSTSTNADRLMWWPSFVQAPFSLVVFTQKSTDKDWYTNPVSGNSDSDGDNDLYEIGLGYKTDGMKLDIAYDYYNYKGNSDTTVATTSYDDQHHQIKGYAEMMLGPVALEGEFAHMFGTVMDYDTGTDIDVDAWAFMLDGSMKMDNLDMGLMYFYASGQDDITAGADREAAMSTLNSDGIGDDFNPYYILTGDHTGFLNGDEYTVDSDIKHAGVQCIGFHADMPVSDKLSLHGAIAYAWADTVEKVKDDNALTELDDEFGWEVDLGAKYKLLDNLTYEVRAAYFNTGEFFDDLNGTTAGVDDIYTLSHHLTMTF